MGGGFGCLWGFSGACVRFGAGVEVEGGWFGCLWGFSGVWICFCGGRAWISSRKVGLGPLALGGFPFHLGMVCCGTSAVWVMVAADVAP